MLPKWLEDLDPNIYHSSHYVVLDFETTNIHYGHWRVPENNIVCVSWRSVKDGKNTDRRIYGSEFDMAELVDVCQSADFIVGHNIQFELGWLARCGYDLGCQPVFCTQIAEHVLSGNRNWRVGLEACLTRREWDGKEGLVSKMIKEGICPSTIPQSWLQRYCDIDVDRTHTLFVDQLKTLDTTGLLPVTYCRNMLTPVLADLATKGMKLDPVEVNNLYEEVYNDVRLLEIEFDKMTGGVNVKSGKQMRVLLYETMGFEPPKDYRGEVMLTGTGEIKTSTEAINALKATTKKQREFIELRNKLVKARDSLSKYIGHFHRCLEETEEGILYAEFNQTRTQTHRLSSTGAMGYNIQFQNIDNRFKPAITSRDDDFFVSEKDYKQLEYRTAVDMARDEAGMESIANDIDRHAKTGSVIFETEWASAEKAADSKTLKALRSGSKAHTFKPLYGGTSGTKAQKKYYDAFKAEHKDITAWQEDNKNTVLREGSLRIPSGLVFYWPDTRIQPSGYITNTAAICNYPVQSFATADIVPIGVAHLWFRIKAAKIRTFMVNTVHDCAISEVHKEEVEIYDELAEQAMVSDVLRTLKKLYNYDFITPLEVESEYFRNWGRDLDTA